MCLSKINTASQITTTFFLAPHKLSDNTCKKIIAVTASIFVGLGTLGILHAIVGLSYLAYKILTLLQSSLTKSKNSDPVDKNQNPTHDKVEEFVQYDNVDLLTKDKKLAREEIKEVIQYDNVDLLTKDKKTTHDKITEIIQKKEIEINVGKNSKENVIIKENEKLQNVEEKIIVLQNQELQDLGLEKLEKTDEKINLCPDLSHLINSQKDLLLKLTQNLKQLPLNEEFFSDLKKSRDLRQQIDTELDQQQLRLYHLRKEESDLSSIYHEKNAANSQASTQKAHKSSSIGWAKNELETIETEFKKELDELQEKHIKVIKNLEDKIRWSNSHQKDEEKSYNLALNKLEVERTKDNLEKKIQDQRKHIEKRNELILSYEEKLKNKEPLEKEKIKIKAQYENYPSLYKEKLIKFKENYLVQKKIFENHRKDILDCEEYNKISEKEIKTHEEKIKDLNSQYQTKKLELDGNYQKKIDDFQLERKKLEEAINEQTQTYNQNKTKIELEKDNQYTPKKSEIEELEKERERLTHLQQNASEEVTQAEQNLYRKKEEIISLFNTLDILKQDSIKCEHHLKELEEQIPGTNPANSIEEAIAYLTAESAHPVSIAHWESIKVIELLEKLEAAELKNDRFVYLEKLCLRHIGLEGTLKEGLKLITTEQSLDLLNQPFIQKHLISLQVSKAL